MTLQPGTSVLVGLIGANIMKSLAPALQGDALAAAGLRGHYHLMDVEQLPGRTLPQLLEAARAVGFLGLNITYPFKQEVMALLDEVSPEARQTGAVNTVTIARDGRTVGHNTDRSGFRRSFQEELGRAAVAGRTAVLVGAGGAGHAVAFALMDLGAACLVVHDQDAARAARLANDLVTHFGPGRARVAAELAPAITEAAGVVNATPIGMLGIPGNPVPVAALHARHWVADVIYTPMRTKLIEAAAAKGARVLTGGGMNIYQALDAFRHFTGLEADAGRMRATFAQALAARDALLAKGAQA